MSLHTTTGQITGLPSVAGTYNFTIEAQTASGCSGQRAYTIIVTCPAVQLSPATLPARTSGTAYQQTLSAAPTGGNYTFAISSGTLPAGLSLNGATGVLSGTPTATGSFKFTVKATGFSTCPGTRAYTLTIANDCPAITLPELPNGLGATYYGDLSGTTPLNSYSFSLVSGALPPGLALDDLLGAVFGTPTKAGSFSFTLKATSPQGCSNTRAYNLTFSGGGTEAGPSVAGDFDGDGKTDLGVWRAAPGEWLVLGSATNQLKTTNWGTAVEPYRDVPVPGDYDGDGKWDWAVWRAPEGKWYLRQSSNQAIRTQSHGRPGDTPVLARP